MEDRNLKKEALVAAFSFAIVLVLIGAATFAWFSNNSRVSTATASGRSGVSQAALLIGPDEGSLVDASENTVDINQVNEASSEKLYPVTTADLETFLYASTYQDGKATGFSQDTDETKLWHGTLCLKMQGEGLAEGTTYKLYLDTADSAGGKIGQSDDGYLLNGARLGLKFEGQEPVILHFDEDNKGTTENNTVVNGVLLSSGNVLDASGNPVSDPSIDFAMVSLDSSAENVEIPEQALATLTLNQPLTIDVFFYLEGCDEDCVGDLAKNEAEIHLAFFAVADENGLQ